MLRALAKQSVFKALDDSYFGVSNFNIYYGDGAPQWLKISFIPNADFVFEVSTAKLGTGFFQISEAPGLRFLKADRLMLETFEQCVQKIPGWIARIKEEVIDSNPINKELQSIRKQLSDRIDSLAEQQEDFFTSEESQRLSERLDAFVQRLDEVAEANDELKDLVGTLTERINELATAAQDVNKGTWFRMAGSRLLNATKAVISSKEGRELALEAARKVLLDGTKS